MRTKTMKTRNGAALILVVVVTVMLAAIGAVFIVVSRISDMSTMNMADNKDLDSAVKTATEQINAVLVQDLFGNNLDAAVICDGTAGNESYDASGADPWLASLEPSKDLPQVNTLPANTDTDPTNDWYKWEYITDLTNGRVVPRWDLILRDGKKTPWDITKKEFGGIVEEHQTLSASQIEGYPADADGDGVADSIWIRLDNIWTSKGKPVFAAVRIIDNCAMLNLNTAYCFYQDPYNAANPKSPFEKTWYLNQTERNFNKPYGAGTLPTDPYANGGRYLCEINYLPFLRGSDLNALWGSNSGDGWYNIFVSKKFGQTDSNGNLTSQVSVAQCHQAIMNIENPGTMYSLFDIGDELELRNRFLMTSQTEARFEQKNIANYTLDSGGGDYAALSVPREDKTESGMPHFARWKWRIDTRNFDITSGAFNDNWNGAPLDLRYRYDRRHVCTFYSFDRNLRTGDYASMAAIPDAGKNYFRPPNYRPINLGRLTFASTADSRRQIVYLLYAFREHFISKGMTPAQAAIKSAQVVANMIDYYDGAGAATQGPFFSAAYGSQLNPNPTFINRQIVRQLVLETSGQDIGQYAQSPLSIYEFGLGLFDTAATLPQQLETVYGYERQPFIAEVFCNYNSGAGGAQAFAIELLNPYQNPNGAISLQGWQITVGTQTFALNNTLFVVPAATSDTQPGRLVFWAENTGYSVPYNGTHFNIAGFGLGTQLLGGDQTIKLQRPDPANSGQFITVDQTTDGQTTQLITGGVRASKRDDRGWKFANRNAYVSADGTARLGFANNVSSPLAGYQMPVANNAAPFDMLGAFEKVAFVGSTTGTSPEPITQKIASAASEADVRFDPAADGGLLKYICFLNRGDGTASEHKDGTLPGRINVNTAARPVIAAAIPPGLADLNLPDLIIANRPYAGIADLLNVSGMKKYAQPSSLNVGDQSIDNDLEERDWILARLANIFTVRSDTFTAYILVRLGDDGPQRRMIAIVDRSGVWKPSDRPKIIALHPVPQAR